MISGTDGAAPLRVPNRRRRSLSAALALASTAAVVSCSGHPPELAAVEYRLALRPLDPKGVRIAEQLSVFAAARDEDGFKDLAALHILNDESEYLWTLTSETWTRNDRSKETWVGGTGLSTPEGGALPRGLYRVVLEDLAGDSVQTSFTLGAGIEKAASFPVILKDGTLVSVSSRYDRTELYFLDSGGTVRRAVEAPREPTSLDRLYGSSGWTDEVVSLIAYAYDAERNLGIFSWTMNLSP